MLLSQLLKNIDIVASNVSADVDLDSVCTDTRKVAEGCLFVCYKRLNFDPHSVAAQIKKDGARVIVCEKKLSDSVPFVQIADTRAALPVILSNFYSDPQKSFRFSIGITGTNGKTSTSMMLREIFTRAGMKTGVVGTMKYLIGDEEYPVDKTGAVLTTPDPEILFPLLARMRDEKVDVLIMETSSHALKLNKLNGLHFSAGIFTNLTQDHLDFHKDMDDYLASKKKLFGMCDFALVNLDDPSYPKIVRDIPCALKTYSAAGDNGADFMAKNVRLKGAEGVEYELLSDSGIFRVRLPIPGAFSVCNSLAAASCALSLGVDRETVLGSLAQMPNVRGRIDRVPIDAPYSVFIDFAHTPDALENVLSTVRGFAQGRIITLFGCGGDRDRKKRPLMGEAASRLSDLVIVTSDNSRSENKADIINDILPGMNKDVCPYEVIEDRTEAIRRAMDIALPGDVIVLAGKGHEEYEIDKTGKHPYSERDVVTEYYKTKEQSR
ncbi:MAG: UDP-N-acetylmuramoyl-L-alanyl-D-glutamate--2,6-diaminopimelate ligase [Clostridia bacterium]|nr:UDP-N-acetylmuramoyl-L-alanyl-D-glutamate--2,6-diaminopimelate ligase [Clostridia bacterium]